jgi:hypothetical protein
MVQPLHKLGRGEGYELRSLEIPADVYIGCWYCIDIYETICNLLLNLGCLMDTRYLVTYKPAKPISAQHEMHQIVFEILSVVHMSGISGSVVPVIDG